MDQSPTYIHTYIHTYTHTYMCVCVYIHIIYIYTYSHTHTYIYIKHSSVCYTASFIKDVQFILFLSLILQVSSEHYTCTNADMDPLMAQLDWFMLVHLMESDFIPKLTNKSHAMFPPTTLWNTFLLDIHSGFINRYFHPSQNTVLTPSPKKKRKNSLLYIHALLKYKRTPFCVYLPP